jgi:hypothetical protein
VKTLPVVVALVFTLIAFGNAYAHGDHEATHGGTVGVGNDEIVVEFVMEHGTLNVYVHDEAGKPLAIKNVTGTLTLIGPHRAQEVKLVSAGDNKFAAPGIAPARGDRMVARITLPSGEEMESAALFAE